jgi:hypothetical protein
MILALMAKCQPFLPPTSTFDNYLIFNAASEASPLLPVKGDSISLPGTSSVPGWTKAVQAQLNMRSASFNVTKLVFLDAASGNTFDPVTDLTTNADLQALYTEFTKVINGWAARDNAQPSTFSSFDRTLNEKLRRRYHMT